MFVSQRCLCHATAMSKEKNISWDLWEFEILVASYIFIQIPIWIIHILFSTRSRIIKKIPNINRKTTKQPPKTSTSTNPRNLFGMFFFWFSHNHNPHAWWNRKRRRRAPEIGSCKKYIEGWPPASQEAKTSIRFSPRGSCDAPLELVEVDNLS